MSFLKRKAEIQGAEKRTASADHVRWTQKHAALAEYLTAEEYPDGGKRQTSTVLIFMEGGEVKACLRDRDTDMSLWVTSGSVPDVLLALESALQSDDAQWRKNATYGGQKKKR